MFLKIISSLILLSCIIMAENPSYNLFKNEIDYNRTKTDYAIGSGLVAAEYIIVPTMMKNVWWPNGFELVNPFVDKYGRPDMEPFQIDEGWHMAMTYFMQDGHYTVLRKFFGIKSPYPSMAMTIFSWTFIEAADAMSKGTKWNFAWNDEIGNCVGVLNWYIHYQYPEFKFYIRGGMRMWEDFDDYFIDSKTFFSDNKSYSKKYAFDKYRISKIEYIYKFVDEFYAGVATSKDNHMGNVWGCTVGWDAISFFNKKTDGWWNYPTRMLGSSFSVSLSLTVWTEDPILTLF